MGLDRDDLAARNMVAAIRTLDAEVRVPPTLADFAVECADALIARLRPATVAPVADAAPTDPRRTVGAVVRDEDSEYAVILSGDGQAQRPLHLDATTDPRWFALDDDEFVRWATRAECEKHGIPYVERGAAPSPAAAPDHPTAASFAARRGQGAEGDQHPAAYVPKVGDVVYVNDRTNAVVYTGYDSRKSPFPHRGVFVHSKIADGWTDGSDFDFVRVATDVDRAIAGLPPITPDHPQGGQGAEAEGRVGDQRVAAGLDAPAKPAVDREGLAKALYAARWLETNGANFHFESRSDRDGWLRAADAAIAFLAAATADAASGSANPPRIKNGGAS